MSKIDPWIDNMNLSKLLKTNGKNEYLIYGPNNLIGLRDYLKIIFYINGIFLNISSDMFDFEVRIDVNLEERSAQINNIESYFKDDKEFYSGTDIMKLFLKILRNIGIIKVLLIDQSKIKCKNRVGNIKHMFSNTIPYSIISLLKNNKTFYMKFGFKPFINMLNKSNNINLILESLKIITWDEIYNIIIMGEKTIKLIKNGQNNILSNEIRNIDIWILYWRIIQKSFEEIYFKFKDIYIGPFSAFEKYNKNDCQMFINWLELYSLSRYYEKTNYIFYTENGIKQQFIIPYKEEFNKLLEIIKKSIWILEDLQNYNSESLINIDSYNTI
jgi:hypothetical protein